MIQQLFADFANFHVAVVGDVMLDTYWWGSTERISPEAPVPVVALNHKEFRIGGAGNVALNLAGLGAKVTLHTVTGSDDDGQLLEQMLLEKGIDTTGVLKTSLRPTTNKIRIISRSQHLLRIDHEVSSDLDNDLEAQFVEHTLQRFNTRKPDVIIFEDYNKGVLTETTITRLLDWCRQHGVISTVDPKRKNFFAYQGVDIFKPNLKEAREALNILDTQASLENLRTIHNLLHQRLGHKISFITLSEKGVFVQHGDESQILPAHIRSIADVSGAGDTVIAVASLVYAATRSVALMAEIANLAGGLVCEEVGTVAIDYHRLLEECLEVFSDEEGGQQMSDG